MAESTKILHTMYGVKCINKSVKIFRGFDLNFAISQLFRK